MCVCVSHVLDVQQYCDLVYKLGHEFEDRFYDLDKPEPCAVFITDPFMEVDKGEISEQMAERLSVNPVEPGRQKSMGTKQPRKCLLYLAPLIFAKQLFLRSIA